MFGHNYEEKFLLGKDKLFMKPNFFQEFDALVKEHRKKEHSRLLPFVQNAITKMLHEHVDNSSKIVRSAKYFLENHATLNRFQKWKRSVNRVINLWRIRKHKKIASEIINQLLHNIPYYNLKKVVKI